MKKITRFFAILFTFLCCFLTGCYNAEELTARKEKFASFQNNPNFALFHFDELWLTEKTVEVHEELNYKGTKIDRLMGCTDEYFYASVRIKKSWRNYTMYILSVDYDTYEMVEIACFENLKDGHSWCCRYENGKLYFDDGNKYCIYHLDNGIAEWFKYDDEAFWREEEGKYSFEIKDRYVGITDTLTNEQKKVSFGDLSGFEEGKFILEIDAKLIYVYSYFETAVERDGICYLLAIVPLDSLVTSYQAVIFAYNFDKDELSYYSSIPYTNQSTKLCIINR